MREKERDRGRGREMVTKTEKEQDRHTERMGRWKLRNQRTTGFKKKKSNLKLNLCQRFQ